MPLKIVAIILHLQLGSNKKIGGKENESNEIWRYQRW